MPYNFLGKTALVTGVSRGIGKGIMEKLLSLDMNVAGVSRDVSSIEKSYENNNLLLCSCDITNENNIDNIIKQAIDKFDRIDFLINNAGITKDNLVIKMNTDEWDNVINTNLRASFMITKKVLKGMIRNRYGRIINISSVIAITGNSGQSNYSAAKSGLIGFTKSIAQELGSRNITVNTIAPGYIETAMTDSLPEKIKNKILDNIPLKRFGSIENVSDLVCFLISDNANYITGQTINVDGGMVMQ